MKFKRILPIIVAVSVIACALIPFAVSADNNFDDISLPDIESNYISEYNGFEKIVIVDALYKKGSSDKSDIIFYIPKIGSLFHASGVSSFLVERVFRIREDNGGYSFGIAGSSVEDGSFVTYGLAYYFFPYNSSEPVALYLYDSRVTFATCDVYDSATGDTLIFDFVPPPSPPPSFSDHIVNVDMSSALVEVLGVLPACLACLVAYASIRKGIGYVRLIISNA